MNRHFTNILCEDPDASAAFYEGVLGMTRHYDMDWFVLLTHPDMPGLEYGLLRRDHPTVPSAHRTAPSGVIVTFVVEDVDAAHRAAMDQGATIISPPTDMPYGQRRVLLSDPSGTVVDISAPVAQR